MRLEFVVVVRERFGVTLPEARALAKHADVNMTMRYTDIGIRDQAMVVANLPNACQDIVSIPRDFERRSLASPALIGTATKKSAVRNPSAISHFVTQRNKKSRQVTHLTTHGGGGQPAFASQTL